MNVVEVYLPVLYESSVISRDHPLPIMTPINGPHGTVVSLREGERERLGAKGEKERGGERRKEGDEGERNEGENQEKRKRKKDEMRERKKGRKERNRILES